MKGIGLKRAYLPAPQVEEGKSRRPDLVHHTQKRRFCSAAHTATPSPSVTFRCTGRDQQRSGMGT
jgi:hypothetical protein